MMDNHIVFFMLLFVFYYILYFIKNISYCDFKKNNKQLMNITLILYICNCVI